MTITSQDVLIPLDISLLDMNNIKINANIRTLLHISYKIDLALAFVNYEINTRLNSFSRHFVCMFSHVVSLFEWKHTTSRSKVTKT